ncbi:MAG: NAD(P)H-dependent oxidoreductase subunit E [Candidatus Tectomicrobia bacterium]|uniref:NAD(P)H-dependent oxidoreductase subunit E n=1 Tax=Tectimicrobiota bacterium TaxID=2528274 RepID=A0A932GQS9_UNCTE|nr:NAD(P)H-dependent oxidoreductase subunit E [Candidatus Tectomicrobia bacterium]
MASEPQKEQIRRALASFPREQTYLLPALQKVQEELGYLPPWALETVSEYTRVPKSEVYGVATHYPELRLHCPGRRHIRVCTGVSCRVNGSLDVLRALSEVLGVRSGETRQDGEVTLEEVGCCFVCSVAPVVEVDGVFKGRVQSSAAASMVNERGRP